MTEIIFIFHLCQYSLSFKGYFYCWQLEFDSNRSSKEPLQQNHFSLFTLNAAGLRSWVKQNQHRSETFQRLLSTFTFSNQQLTVEYNNVSVGTGLQTTFKTSSASNTNRGTRSVKPLVWCIFLFNISTKHYWADDTAIPGSLTKVWRIFNV